MRRGWARKLPPAVPRAMPAGDWRPATGASQLAKPKQHPNGMPGKKPPAPSAKVPMTHKLSSTKKLHSRSYF
jgi:hypothetical protein